MICGHCGKKVAKDTIFCPYCDELLPERSLLYGEEHSYRKFSTMALMGFLFSFFAALPGLICCLIAYRQCYDKKYRGKRLAVAGFTISVIRIAVEVLLFVFLSREVFGIF